VLVPLPPVDAVTVSISTVMVVVALDSFTSTLSVSSTPSPTTRAQRRDGPRSVE